MTTDPTTKKDARVSACGGISQHMMNLLFFGRCGCWDEGRNRHPYWGWKP